jgi:hypothetical protein
MQEFRALSNVAVHSFERLLASRPSLDGIDQFLEGLRSERGVSDEVKDGLARFSAQGDLRDQVPFLLNLYKNGFFIDARRDSRVAFVFFNGMLAPVTFAAMRARLCAMNASCIYLYDDQFLNYSLGVRQLGVDVRESDDALRTMLRQCRAERLVTIGYSAGGFAAIKCALSLNAYCTVAFSPFTTLDERQYIHDGRGQGMLRRMRQLAPESLIDLIPLLKQREPALKLISFFGEAMEKDVWHSRRLNGVKGACTIPINGEISHDVASLLIAGGIFDTLFRQLSQGESIEKSLKVAIQPRRAEETRPFGTTPKFAAVTRVHHTGKKWQGPKSYNFASADALVPIVSAELPRAALSMPLAFLQQESGFVLVAVASLVPGRNMLVAPDGRWLGRYIPARLRGYPFCLLPRPGTDQLVLCVDMNSGLVLEGGSVGEDFFDGDGNLSVGLKEMADFLGQLERSRKATETAVSALAEAGVIQPWPIRPKAEQADRTISALHRVDQAALNALSDEAFLKLRKTSALPIAYAQMLSMGQLGLLEQITRLQAQLAPAPAAALPESLDSLFGISSGESVKFDGLIEGDHLIG